MSDSVRPQRQKPTRFPRPWDSPGKNTGVGCHFLLQCMKVKSESEVAQSCLSLRDPMDCSLPGSSSHGIFQARVLEWGAMAFSENKRWHFKTITFFIFDQLMRQPFIELFHFSNLLEMPNDHRMVNVEFFSNFSVRGSASMMALNRSLSTSYGQLYYTPHLQGSCLLYRTSWTTTALYIC